jgi:hypothetical protein
MMNLIDTAFFFVWTSLFSVGFYMILAAIHITFYILHKFHTALHVDKNKMLYMRQMKFSIIFGLATSSLVTYMVCGKYNPTCPVPGFMKEFLLYNSVVTIAHVIVLAFTATAITITWVRLYSHIGIEHKKLPKIE